MTTIRYKDWFIHIWLEPQGEARWTCRVQAPSLRCGPPFRSVTSAKRYIREAIKTGQFQ